jgi:hypothetical protein
MTLLFFLFVGTGVLVVALSVPLIQGRVPPNHWYGLRIRATLDDPDVWHPANRYAGWLLLAYGLVMLVASLGLGILLGGIDEESAVDIYGLCMAALLLLGIVPLVVLGLRYARQVAKDQLSDEASQGNASDRYS